MKLSSVFALLSSVMFVGCGNSEIKSGIVSKSQVSSIGGASESAESFATEFALVSEEEADFYRELEEFEEENTSQDAFNLKVSAPSSAYGTFHSVSSCDGKKVDTSFKSVRPSSSSSEALKKVLNQLSSECPKGFEVAEIKVLAQTPVEESQIPAKQMENKSEVKTCSGSGKVLIKGQCYFTTHGVKTAPSVSCANHEEKKVISGTERCVAKQIQSLPFTRPSVGFQCPQGSKLQSLNGKTVCSSFGTSAARPANVSRPTNTTPVNSPVVQQPVKPPSAEPAKTPVSSAASCNRGYVYHENMGCIKKNTQSRGSNGICLANYTVCQKGCCIINGNKASNGMVPCKNDPSRLCSR